MVDSKKLISLVEKYEKLIYDTADHIWAHPETGYREWKTSAYMEQHFEELGYTLTKAGNIPGFYTAVSYTHLRAHETGRNLVCRHLIEKKKIAKSLFKIQHRIAIDL